MRVCCCRHKDGEVTQGGYSTFMVVKDAFTLKIKPSLHRPATAPLLCAGITVYSPMRYYGADKKGQKVAVLGLGGLGHMVVKCALFHLQSASPRCNAFAILHVPHVAVASLPACSGVLHFCTAVHAAGRGAKHAIATRLTVARTPGLPRRLASTSQYFRAATRRRTLL